MNQQRSGECLENRVQFRYSTGMSLGRRSMGLGSVLHKGTEFKSSHLELFFHPFIHNFMVWCLETEGALFYIRLYHIYRASILFGYEEAESERARPRWQRGESRIVSKQMLALYNLCMHIVI
jgi:hypothetical protein